MNLATIGVDEVGRGAWAGPLLVVAAQANADLPLELTDSKLLSRKQRQRLFEQIRLCCVCGEGWVSVREIDAYGLAEAMRLGVKRALAPFSPSSSTDIIFDGRVNYCPPSYKRVRTIIRADRLHPIVSAASIYAKVLRDTYMAGLQASYPHFYFENHVGYGTKQHQKALETFGVTKEHRKSFKPIRVFK